MYKSLTTARLEVLLTETILQTSRLQDLYIYPRRIFSGGDYFLALACSEFSSYCAVWIDGAELYQASSLTCERPG